VILDSSYTFFDDKFLILEMMCYSKNNINIIETLLKYSKNPIPALREVALYSMSFFPNEETINRLEELEIMEDNLIIKSSVKFYLQEIFV